MIARTLWIVCLIIGVSNLIISGVDDTFFGFLVFVMCATACIATCDRVWN